MGIRSLPLVTLYLTERCNSRCVSCDYWRHGRTDMSPQSVARLIPSLQRLGTRVVVISGGEPLVHPQWAGITELLRAGQLQVWLLTAGLSLAKHAVRAAELFASITVSLDGSDAPMYAAIRGLDAFDKVCEGIERAAAAGAWVGVRVTVQRGNFEDLSAFVEIARGVGARQISFLAADVANPNAFGRSDGFARSMALRPEDLPRLAQSLDALERQHRREFESGFIAESPAKMRRILHYGAAVCGLGSYPPTHCNAPEFSAVIEAGGQIRPCFFIPGPAVDPLADLDQGLNGPAMTGLRTDIRAGRRPECSTCVCSMWRNLEDPAAMDFSAPRATAAA